MFAIVPDDFLFLNNMETVLDKFSVREFALNQSEIFSRSCSRQKFI